MTVIDKFYRIKFDENTLMLDRPKGYACYDATPIGAKVFASMGVDGIHYCIMPREGDITLENSPVYRISPMDFAARTVVWTAKNFYDFISISIELKDFWALPCLVGLDKDEFVDLVEQYEYEFEMKNECEKTSILCCIESLRQSFNLVEIRNMYSYIQAAYSDKHNHLNLVFSTSDIFEEKLGIYHL